MSRENVEVVGRVYARFAHGDFRALANEPLTIEATEFIEAGDNVEVAVRQHGRLRGSASEVEGRWWYVHTMPGGNLARIQAFPDRRHALEAVGLRE
jgi:ketosteroid isomerase-like protein